MTSGAAMTSWGPVTGRSFHGEAEGRRDRRQDALSRGGRCRASDSSHRRRHSNRMRPQAAILAALLVAEFSVLSTSAAVRLRRAISSGQSKRPQLSSSLCLSKGCVTAAYKVLDKMDPAVDPCDDFFRFACGGFVNKTVIPDDKSSMSQFSIMSDALKQQMRKLVDAPVTKDDPPATVLARHYFASCMNNDIIEKKGTQPMADMLAKMGGWPVLEDQWDENTFQWTEAIYQNRKLGYSHSHLFSFSVQPDIKNYSRRLIDIDDPPLGLGRKYLIKGFNDSDMQAYYNYMRDMAVLMGADPEKAKMEMEDAVRFEIQLANMSLSAEERRNVSKLYNLMTLDELSQIAPSIPWVEISNKLLEDAGHQVDSTETAMVSHPEYLKNLSSLLDTTPKRILANYLRWRVVKASVDNLDLAARDIKLKFVAKVYGRKQHKPRWEQCLKPVLDNLHIAAGSLFVKNHFDPESKRGALELVGDVHKQFDRMLEQLTWMDENTRQRAMDKSKNITYYIAYPDEQLNDTLVAEYYEGLNISDVDYFSNDRSLKTFFVNKAYRKLREPVDRKDWKRHSHTAIINAFYSAQENSITFPAGILQDVFYDNSRPKYMNYGAIGFVVGHEISHGFDDKGRQFAGDGELKEWWEPETREQFLEGAQCIIDQYGNITLDRVEMNVNGITTQGENIADNGGMKIARGAYEQYQQRAGREPALPGLQQFTNEQMFWLGSANAWCTVYRDEYLRLLLLTDSHAPSFLRVNVPLRNYEQFAIDWQCPVGSPMNPAKRCGVW